MSIPKPKGEEGSDGLEANKKRDTEVQLPQTLVRIPVEQALPADSLSEVGKGE